jgi:hypothetical protein
LVKVTEYAIKQTTTQINIFKIRSEYESSDRTGKKAKENSRKKKTKVL